MATQNKVSNSAISLLEDVIDNNELNKLITSLSETKISSYNDYNLRRMFVEQGAFGEDNKINSLSGSQLLINLIRL